MCLSVGRSVGRSVRKVYCGKTTDWIWMPFGVVSGVGRGTGVLDRGKDRRMGSGNLGHLIVINGELWRRYTLPWVGGDAHFPNYFGISCYRSRLYQHTEVWTSCWLQIEPVEFLPYSITRSHARYAPLTLFTLRRVRKSHEKKNKKTTFPRGRKLRLELHWFGLLWISCTTSSGTNPQRICSKLKQRA